MAIAFRFVGGERAGESVSFDDSQEIIRLGRDAEECQVVFPAGLTAVGREHCLIRNESGKYRLEVPPDHKVYLDGAEVRHQAVLSDQSQLQIGPGGPRLVVTITGRPGLPPTTPQGRGEGTATIADRAGRSARRGTMIAVSSMLGLALVAVAGWAIAERLGKDVVETKEETRKTKTEVARLSDEQARKLQSLEETSKAAAAAANVPAAETVPAWKQVVEKVTPSVYLVLIRDADDYRNSMATAWVADRDRGLLATNAHVAQLFVDLEEGQSLVLRSTGDSPTEVVVDTVVIHPGVDQFESLWTNYDPVVPVSAEGYLSIDRAGPACDVGLLHVTDASSLGPDLKVAPAESLRSLAAGDEVAYVGFPMEGLALGGVNIDRPAPKAQLGYVVSTTDYFGGAAPDPDQRLLVQHALAASGGASGSPILNRKGEVVAVHNAGNVIGEIDGVRVESDASIFFAQRADLVRELLDGTAGERQEARRGVWEQEVKKYFLPRTGVERASIERQTLRDWTAEIAADELVEVKAKELAAGTISLSEDPASSDVGRAEWPFEVPAAGRYQVQVVATDQYSGVWLDVVDPETEEFLRTGYDFLASWHDAASFTTEGSRKLTARVHGRPIDAEVELKLNVAEVSPTTVEEAVGRRVARWEEELSEERGAAVTKTIVSERSGVLSETLLVYGDRYTLEMPGAGDYFLIAAPEGDEPLNMSVGVPGESEGEAVMLVEDRRLSPVAFGRFRLEGALTAEVYVSSSQAGRYKATLYKADEPAEVGADPAPRKTLAAGRRR